MKKILIITILLSLLANGLISAYPPDNAAVLYYKNMEYDIKPDDAIWEEIRNLPTSDEPASQKAKEFIKRGKQQQIIKDLITASELKSCDWGYDFSQGFEMLIPGLSQMKNFRYLLLADSAILAAEGDIAAALERNLAVRRMAQHISNDIVIGFLVSFSITKDSSVALEHLLGTYPIDEKTLAQLKDELSWEVYQPKSFRHPLMMEKETCLREIARMTPERYREVMTNPKDDSEITKHIYTLLENNDPAFLERSAAYMEKWFNNNMAAIEKPYVQAYTEFQVAQEKPVQDAKTNDDAVLSACLTPWLAKVYDYSIRWKTNHDAMMTAIDIYLEAAKTGKLPELLPASTYIDHFSGKPFIYEVTKEGFTLRCQQEDLVDKKVQEYAFKLPK